MNRSSDIGRVHQAARTAMPGGFTRQSAAATPMGSRGVFQRTADTSRSRPTQRGANDDEYPDKDKEDEDDDSDDQDDGGKDENKKKKKAKSDMR